MSSVNLKRRIIHELQALRQQEMRLQASYAELASAGREARISFLLSLNEWEASAQQLERLIERGQHA